MIDRGRATRRPPRTWAVAVGLVLLVLVAGGCEPVRQTRRDRPVLLVHGWNIGGGTDCASTFDPTIAQLRAEGFTGPFVKVGFYTGDTGCSMSLRSWGSFDNGSSWKAVAQAFSRYVHDTYTDQGVPVDVIGYSMGGNIARGAVYGSSIGESGFSAPIQVEDVVTLGAPHDGAAWYSYLCLWGQCSTLKPGRPTSPGSTATATRGAWAAPSGPSSAPTRTPSRRWTRRCTCRCRRPARSATPTSPTPGPTTTTAGPR